jgi:hypothetical protein
MAYKAQFLVKSAQDDEDRGSGDRVNAALFNRLCEKQITPRNPTIGVKRPKVNAKEVKAPV